MNTGGRQNNNGQTPATPSIEELDAQPTTPLDRAKPVEGAYAQTTLLVQHAGQVRVVELALGSSLDIGRSRKAALTIEDEALSRVHARFELTEDGQLWIEDLDSMNGTQVGGSPVDRAPLRARSVVTMGTVRIVVDRLQPREPNAVELLDHGRFVDELRQELVRCRDFGHTVALLMLRQRDGGDTSWYEELGSLARPSDRLAVFAEDTLEVMLPQRAFDQAHELARVIRSRLAAGDRLLCAVATFPDCAGSAEELVSAAFTALRSAGEDAPIKAASRIVDRAVRSTIGLHHADADTDTFVAVSPAMRAIEESLTRLADSRLPVLIWGETGVGKEVIASALHNERPGGKSKPLICINCGAIPELLLESTLFGHERGAFTGAHARRKGVFEEAGAGTVFLDEVGELSARAQVVLLRVIESRVVARVGSSRAHPIKASLTVATNRDLAAMVEAGTFRRDLLYRLNGVVIKVPPLRERPEDILPLARMFLAQVCQLHGQRPKTLDESARQALGSYGWPGNARELRNVLERAVAMGASDAIALTDLPQELWRSEDHSPHAIALSPGDDVAPESERLSLKATLQAAERALLFEALERASWNRARAARDVDLPARTLAHKIQALGIEQGVPYDTEILGRAQLDGVNGGIRDKLRALQALLLREALDACAGNKSAAARRLGLSRSAFLARLTAKR